MSYQDLGFEAIGSVATPIKLIRIWMWLRDVANFDPDPT